MKVFDEKFRGNKARYILQCILATLSVLIVLLSLDAMANAVIIAALGASFFIAFTMPEAQVSRPRFLNETPSCSKLSIGTSSKRIQLHDGGCCINRNYFSVCYKGSVEAGIEKSAIVKGICSRPNFSLDTGHFIF